MEIILNGKDLQNEINFKIFYLFNDFFDFYGFIVVSERTDN